MDQKSLYFFIFDEWKFKLKLECEKLFLWDFASIMTKWLRSKMHACTDWLKLNVSKNCSTSKSIFTDLEWKLKIWNDNYLLNHFVYNMVFFVFNAIRISKVPGHCINRKTPCSTARTAMNVPVHKWYQTRTKNVHKNKSQCCIIIRDLKVKNIFVESLL